MNFVVTNIVYIDTSIYCLFAPDNSRKLVFVYLTKTKRSHIAHLGVFVWGAVIILLFLDLLSRFAARNEENKLQ